MANKFDLKVFQFFHLHLNLLQTELKFSNINLNEQSLHAKVQAEDKANAT